MGWVNFEGPFPEEPHHPEHAMLETMVRDILFSVFLLAFVQFFGKKLDRKNSFSSVSS
jgi:hypothetical protein